MKKKKEGAGGKLNRSEIVQTRLNQKLRFAAELISKFERRTISSLIETALETYLKIRRLEIVDVPNDHICRTVDEMLERVWSPEESTRFVKTGLIFQGLMTSKEEDLFYFIEDKNYFWANYEVTIYDGKKNILRKEWRPYLHEDGLIEENLKEYWNQIKTKEGMRKTKIPDKPGKIIKAPPGHHTKEIEEIPAETTLESVLLERDRYHIWNTNVHTLIKKDYEIIDTPEGKKTIMKIIYPTPEEQMEMVERIYQERNK